MKKTISAGVNAETVPAPFHIVTLDDKTEMTPEAMEFQSTAQSRDIRISEAAWLQIEFGSYNLGETGTLRIESLDNGESQI